MHRSIVLSFDEKKKKRNYKKRSRFKTGKKENKSTKAQASDALKGSAGVRVLVSDLSTSYLTLFFFFKISLLGDFTNFECPSF